MWISLSDGMFFFGSGGITGMRKIDLRDKPNNYVYRTELLCGATKVDIVTETIEDITKMLEEKSLSKSRKKTT